MGFENFRLNVVARVVILAVLCLASVWSWVNTTWLVTPIVTGVLMLFSAVELIRYVEQTSRELSSFLSFVSHHDFSAPISNPQKGRVFAGLRDAYRVLSTEFRRLNVQKAANHQYLEAVIEHVGVALVCLDDEGNVKMMNEPARRLFDVPHLNSLRTFSRIDARLPDLLQNLGDGERALLSVQRGDETLQLVLYGKRFELLEQQYKLVSFQNIGNELSQQEIDSWQRLIRVLTHEIMNSVTPVISLSRLMRETMIEDRGGSPAFRTLTPQEQDDMLRSVTAIHTRSSGLLDFVQAYRSFAKLPTPEFSDVNVVSLLERVRTLMAREIEAARITLALQCDDEKLSIRADARQAEQVLINLVRNALEALADRPAPRIDLRGLADDEGRVLLQVIDNGPGIPAEHLEDIFVPFFTTKRNGTGVGLSISRQIMQANHGFVSVRSAPGEGCVFTLRFGE
jgi:two-component system, NtrC family, nitrogen regulation sensor histidine kinase NtrY